MPLHTLTYSRIGFRVTCGGTDKKKKSFEDLKKELKPLREENGKLRIELNQMRFKPKWDSHSHRIKYPVIARQCKDDDRLWENVIMQSEIHKQIAENKPDKSLKRQNAMPIGHNIELLGDDLQEFIDPDLLENGDGTID